MSLQETLKALADPVRRDILNLLKTRTMSAGQISEHFDISFPAVSRHLSVLKQAGLIRESRRGKFVDYQINASVLEEVLLWIKDIQGEK